MSETDTSWLPWRSPRAIENGVETMFHHPLIEVRRPGEPESRCVDPLDLLAEGDLSGTFWRPTIWAREGAANRRMRHNLIADNVARGKDGYLMARFHSAFEQVYEGLGLSDIGARKWVEELRRRQAWYAARGAVFRWLVIPEFQSACPDKVPGCPTPSPDRPIMRILRAADPEVRACIVYPLQQLLEGRARHDTNCRDDVHLTFFGSFLCYRALLETLPGCAPERALQESELIRVEGPTIGGYGYALGLERYNAVRMVPPPTPSRKLVSDPRFATGHVDVLETDFPELPTMVTFRTSNSSALFAFYLRHFSRIVAVAGRVMLTDLLESEMPHVVIEEIPERSIAANAAVPGYDPDFAHLITERKSFEEFTSLTLPLPRTHPARVLAARTNETTGADG